jgi:uncharacterized protein with NRDE domain
MGSNLTNSQTELTVNQSIDKYYLTFLKLAALPILHAIMCIVACGVNIHPSYALILVTNRDEFYARPSRPAHVWSDGALVAGLDDQSCGSWLAARVGSSRVAVVTNHRSGPKEFEDKHSRGDLVVDFCQRDRSDIELSAAEYCRSVHAHGEDYNGFNLLAYDGNQLCHVSNRHPKSDPQQVHVLEPGRVYGLCNGLLDTPWPKTERLKSLLEKTVRLEAKETWNHDDLLNLLRDTQMPRDEHLPDTNVGIELERLLAPIFIQNDEFGYGTVCSTVVTITHDGQMELTEYTYGVGARQEGKVHMSWNIWDENCQNGNKNANQSTNATPGSRVDGRPLTSQSDLLPRKI